jgi:hypothetical protein
MEVVNTECKSKFKKIILAVKNSWSQHKVYNSISYQAYCDVSGYNII